MDLKSPIFTEQKTGDEKFSERGKALRFGVIDFWKWNSSDLVSNVTRGRLAEFIIAKALEIDTTTVRDEWAPYDLATQDGTKIEVKSAAYIQSWRQNEFSKISYSIKESLSWDRETNKQAKIKTRDADIYIFALLTHKDKDSVDPMNLDQWCFYVLSITEIRTYKRSKQSITLKSLEKLTQAVSFNELQTEFRKKSI